MALEFMCTEEGKVVRVLD